MVSQKQLDGLWRFARVCDVGPAQFKDPNLPKNDPQSSEKRPEIVRKSSKIGPGGSQNRPNCVPEAVAAQVFDPSGQKVRFGRFFGRFWTIYGEVSGAKIVPKSTKMASGTRSIFDPISDLRFDRFSTRLGSQNGIRNRRFWSPEPVTADLGRNLKIW